MECCFLGLPLSLAIRHVLIYPMGSENVIEKALENAVQPNGVVEWLFATTLAAIP